MIVLSDEQKREITRISKLIAAKEYSQLPRIISREILIAVVEGFLDKGEVKFSIFDAFRDRLKIIVANKFPFRDTQDAILELFDEALKDMRT